MFCATRGANFSLKTLHKHVKFLMSLIFWMVLLPHCASFLMWYHMGFPHFLSLWLTSKILTVSFWMIGILFICFFVNPYKIKSKILQLWIIYGTNWAYAGNFLFPLCPHFGAFPLFPRHSQISAFLAFLCFIPCRGYFLFFFSLGLSHFLLFVLF